MLSRGRLVSEYAEFELNRYIDIANQSDKLRVKQFERKS
jgi:hypothetical protein